MSEVLVTFGYFIVFLVLIGFVLAYFRKSLGYRRRATKALERISELLAESNRSQGPRSPS
jgi:Flp pilus assembly protein TadB